jgi:hypothetical protein
VEQRQTADHGARGDDGHGCCGARGGVVTKGGVEAEKGEKKMVLVCW